MERKDFKEIQVTSTLDWLKGSLGFVILVGLALTLLAVLGVDVLPAEPSDDDLFMFYAMSATLVFLYPLYAKYTSQLFLTITKSIGQKLYVRKNQGGFPIDESNKSYRFVESTRYIRDNLDEVEMNKQNLHKFQYVTWLYNMETKQKLTIDALRKKNNKLNKRLKRRRYRNKVENIKKEIETNREYIELCVEWKEAIDNNDDDKVIELDNKIIEFIDVNYQDIYYEDVLNHNYRSTDDPLDKFFNTAIVRKINLYVLPILWSIAIVGFFTFYDYESMNIDQDIWIMIWSIMVVFLGKLFGISRNVYRNFRLLVDSLLEHVNIIRRYQEFIVLDIWEDKQKIKSEQRAISDAIDALPDVVATDNESVILETNEEALEIIKTETSEFTGVGIDPPKYETDKKETE